MTNKTSKYKYGDRVRVAAGVNDPDFMTNIEGWTGEIDEIEFLDNGSWMYRIVWDKDTLLMAGEDYITKCEEDNLDHENIYLEENELELLESNTHKKPRVFIA